MLFFQVRLNKRVEHITIRFYRAQHRLSSTIAILPSPVQTKRNDNSLPLHLRQVRPPFVIARRVRPLIHSHISPITQKNPLQALQLRLLPRLATPHQASKTRQRRRRAPPRRLARPLPSPPPRLVFRGGLHARVHALLQPAQHPLPDFGRPCRVRRHRPVSALGYGYGYTATTTTTTNLSCGWRCVGSGSGLAF
jgi:hypothetical protein